MQVMIKEPRNWLLGFKITPLGHLLCAVIYYITTTTISFICLTVTKYYSLAKATWIKLWFLFKSNIWNNVKYINHWLFSTISRIRNPGTRTLKGNEKLFELSQSIAMLKLISFSALQCMVQRKFIRNANMIRHFLYKKTWSVRFTNENQNLF